MNQPAPVIEFEGVSKRYDGDLVLHPLDLSIRPGEFITFLGPSGCGKTTLLRLIAGFEAPTSGEIYLNGRNVTDLPPNKREVNTVFQSYALFPHMNVYDNVAFGLRRQKTAKDEIDRRVNTALDLVQLGRLGKRMPDRLSGGQQQRVALARALVNEPSVLLLDEPLSALDFKLRKQMQSDLKHLQRQLGITFVFVTHDQEEAFSMSDRVVVLDEGAIRQIGTPERIYEEPENLFVASFVGDINILEATVVSVEEDDLHTEMYGKPCVVGSKRTFDPGEKVNVLLRPEDIRLYRPDEPESEECILWGTVYECVYKGATVDITVDIVLPEPSNESIHVMATEFFDEDAEKIVYTPGEPVGITWVHDWEVVLPDEDHAPSEYTGEDDDDYGDEDDG
ncbi:MAG: spermidine/putrescine ABC transporter ATP-binding protein PotA [Desulfovibrio sp.]|uniref:spermidine/putrescine ABC transporter ATP-binding protein PotA n=1 Tax=Desulfovibrio sp. 7SRBS1 TaxID=3378064 RepID=UPI003B3E767B